MSDMWTTSTKRRSGNRLLLILSLSLDLITIVVAFYAVAFLRARFPIYGSIDLAVHTNILVIALPFFAFSLCHVGLYDAETWATRPVLQDIELTIKALLSALMVVVLIIFTIKYLIISHLFVFSFGLLSIVLLSLERVAVNVTTRVLSDSTNQRNVLVVGTGERAQEFIKMLNRAEDPMLHLMGVLADGPPASSQVELPILGQLGDLPLLMESRAVDAVVFAVPYSSIPTIRDAFAHCLQVGVAPYIFARPFHDFPGHAQLQYVGDIPFVGFTTVQQSPLDLFAKRVFDICFSAATLLLFAPFGACIAIAIKYTSKGPVIFKQRRGGKNGRLFSLYKFRTMRVDAEDLKAQLASLNEMRGPVFKIRDDPRTTAFGRLLRRTSLDEFPQFVNVLLGHMSVVGPRPPLPEEVSQYELWQRRRLSVKPGLTCLWQVSGRNDVDFHSWMKLDLHYIDNWSWSLDLKILLRTIPAMLRGY